MRKTAMTGWSPTSFRGRMAGEGSCGLAGRGATLKAQSRVPAAVQRGRTPTAPPLRKKEHPMAVLERSELEASPLADLHAIANQMGLDGFRRLRKAQLISAILGEPDVPEASEEGSDAEDGRPARPRRRRSTRTRRSNSEEGSEPSESAEGAEGSAPSGASNGARRGRSRGSRGGSGGGSAAAERSPKASDRDEPADTGDEAAARIAAGVVEVLGNGSAFLRVDPPEPSDDDVYVSAAQVRRCELVSGDRVAGPVRTPRRSERYPSLVRIDTINGASADAVAEGARYEDLPVDWPSERLALDSKDPTLEAIEWLTPLGRGSRAVIVGPMHSGKTLSLIHI